MTDELLDKPGTTPEQTGEPAPETGEDSERLEGADREAGDAAGEEKEDRTDWKGMALGLKGRLEEVNRQQENEQRLRAAQPSPTADPQMAQAQAEIARIQQSVVHVQAAADQGDPIAVATMAMLAEQYQSAQQRIADRREYLNEMALLRIRDEDEREAVRAYFDAHRNECANVQVARKAMFGERYESEQKTLAKKTKLADEVVANKKAGVKTAIREVPTQEAKARRMTESDYDNDIARLRAEGDHAGVRARMRDLQSGNIKLTPG